jgi:hypothetical protein
MKSASRPPNSPRFSFLSFCAAYWQMFGFEPREVPLKALRLLSGHRKIQAASERNLEELFSSSEAAAAFADERLESYRAVTR